MQSISAKDVMVEPMTIVVIIKACGIGSTMGIPNWVKIGIVPSSKLPKLRNKRIMPVSTIVTQNTDLIIFLLVARP